MISSKNLRLIFLLTLFISKNQISQAQIKQQYATTLTTLSGGRLNNIKESVVDDSGNVYTCAYGNGLNGEMQNYYTFKHNKFGKLMWEKSYNNDLMNNIDRATSIAIDDSSFIYVTGNSIRSGGRLEAATIKYSSSGQQIWVSRFSASQSDKYPVDICVDKQGNSFITGYRTYDSGNADMFTIKYDKSGNQVWADFYVNSNVHASSIITDDVGNIYVAGYMGHQVYSSGVLTFVIIKYNSFGQKLWIKETSDILMSNGSNMSSKINISIGKSGSIYVAGRGVSINNDTNTINDIILVKLNPNTGALIWSQLYDYLGKPDYPSDLVIDNKDNIYICGVQTNSSDKTDYVVLKYTSNGTLAWTKSYDGLSQGNDYAIACSLDTNQFLYVSGHAQYPIRSYDYTTIKYDSTGVVQWLVNYSVDNGNSWDDKNNYVTDLNINKSGNIFVTGQDGIVKYSDTLIKPINTDIEPICINQPQSVVGYDIVTDTSDFFYVVGQSQGNERSAHIAKYAANMDTVWTKKYSSGNQANDLATSVDVDDFGNVYVGSMSDDGSTLIKYDSNGIFLWKKKYGFSAEANTVKRVFVKVTDDNNVYFVRSNWNQSLGAFPLITEKYSPSGTVLWSKNYYLSANGGGSNIPKAITTKNDTIYILGSSQSSNLEMITLKYDPFGNLLWSKVYSTPSDDDGIDIDIDDIGNVYVVGNTTINSKYNFIIIKYNSSGTQKWVYTYKKPQNYDFAVGIEVSNEIYVAGNTFGNLTFSKYVALKLNLLGNLIWEKQYDANGGLATSAILDKNNNFYLSGEMYLGSSPLYFTVKYNSVGEVIFSNATGPSVYGGSINAIALDNDSVPYVTGSQYENNFCYTLKYDDNYINRTNEYVWPGDADHNGLVNNLDLLSIGLANGKTGRIRLGANLNWIGQPAQNWKDTLVNGTNYKHIDCNGDGIINNNDTNAIIVNYSLTHSKRNDITPQQKNEPNLTVKFSNDTLYTGGNQVIIPISIGDQTISVDSIYGLAFSIFLNNYMNIEQGSLFFVPTNSWFGTPNINTIAIDYNNFNNGRIDVALVRTNQLNASGQGIIGELHLRTTNSSLGSGNNSILTISPGNITAITNNESVVTLGGISDSIIIKDYSPSNYISTINTRKVGIYPNPSNGNLTINIGEKSTTEVIITNVLGQEVSKKQYSNTSILNIEIEGEDGIYFLNIKSGNKMANVKIIKQSF